MTALTLEEVQQLHQSGNLIAAREGYLKILEQNPNHESALHMLGILCAEEGDWEAALRHLKKALTINPDNPTLYLHLANTLKSTGEHDQAVSILLDLCNKYPQFVSGFNNLGTVYYAQGKWREAQGAFQTAINLQPNYVDAYYNLGLAFNKDKRYLEAINTYKSLLDLAPEHAGAHFQLGCILMQQSQIPRAIEQFLAIVEQHPNHFETQTNLATCYLSLGKLHEAKNHYQKAAHLNPNDTQILFNLGVITSQLGRMDEAIHYYERCIGQNRDHFAAHNNLGTAYLAMKNRELALQHFKEALRIAPHDEAIRHTVAVLSKEKNVHSSPIEYVRNLFDSYADHYDQHLSESLHYRVPAEFAKTLQEQGIVGEPDWTVLDLGCGTGLCGELIKQKRRLVGVDISEKMLAIAREKHIYHELVQGDIAAYLKETDSKYDLMMAGDVLVYYGDLVDLFAEIGKRLKPGGYFIFNAEESTDKPFVMTDSGRFAHSKAYLDSLARQNQFTIIAYRRAQLRNQNGSSLQGHIYLLKRAP